MSDNVHVVCHYGEIALKGRNRPWFEKKLRQALVFALRDLTSKLTVQSLRGRILLILPGDANWDDVQARLKRVTGLTHFARAMSSPPSIEGLREELARLLVPGESRSFAVRVKREDKSFPLKSPEIEREVGGWIADRTGWRVDLTKPDTTVYVEWMRDRVWFYWERTPGPGGMPIGIGGKAACLMSGGIDSPVAAYLLMKRGCQPVFVHFHSFPFTDSASQGKVCSLVEELCRDRCSAVLHMIPFAELQQEVVVAAPPKYRILLYRRFMLRIAQEIAIQEGCSALVTGDSLAQVSSQTMENLAAINAVAQMPVFRPLIGWDKQEIIAKAQEIGTFEISILPHDDCCSWFMPQTLELRARPEDLTAAEQDLDVPGLVAKALAGIESRRFGEQAEEALTLV